MGVLIEEPLPWPRHMVRRSQVTANYVSQASWVHGVSPRSLAEKNQSVWPQWPIEFLPMGDVL
jgi:hypothetical protein